MPRACENGRSDAREGEIMGRNLAGALLALVLASGCITLGRDFPSDPVKKIVNGTTTREQIRATFGEPFQTGIDNGRESWTYYKVRY